MNNTRILVVDDDPKLRNLLRNCFEGEGAHVLEAATGQDALDQIADKKIDLVTLDISLGGDDGFEIARRIRSTSQLPIIMVTGKNDVIDRVVGLEIGADDYITKPFHVREVIARVKTVLRRTKGGAGTEPPQGLAGINGGDKSSSVTLSFDGLRAVPDRLELINRDGTICDLTSGDFKLLNVFLSHPKRVLSREMLMDLLGGVEWAPLDRTVDNQVARLRKKIERAPAKPMLIKTVRGVGYSLACDVVSKLT